jgi:hypothetical protein
VPSPSDPERDRPRRGGPRAAGTGRGTAGLFVPICALQMRCTYPVTLAVRLGVRRAGLSRQSAAPT